MAIFKQIIDYLVLNLSNHDKNDFDCLTSFSLKCHIFSHLFNLFFGKTIDDGFIVL
jgi:hypothetical protein